MNNTVISAKGLVKEYGKGAVMVKALRGVDLDIPRGSFTCIVGPSGHLSEVTLQLQRREALGAHRVVVRIGVEPVDLLFGLGSILGGRVWPPVHDDRRFGLSCGAGDGQDE